MNDVVTPDQRLRVFISSTLHELALERRSALHAITGLHLTPVLFELGARPHPPRSLYRSYLEQSDVFVAIYWESYGWVAPGEQVSGLEDELRLAGSKPKLVYVKEPAPNRDPRLTAMLDRLRTDDTTTYAHFAEPADLERMIADDLAVLLSERFTQDETEAPRTATPAALPHRYDKFIGRIDELEALKELVLDDDVRLVTLTGPGGIGKTRLALELARAVGDAFRDGVRFVELARLSDPRQLMSTVAQTLGLRSERSPEAAVAAHLADRHVMLLLDNLEHLLPASSEIAHLLEHTAHLKVLATSRAALGLRGEHDWPVAPLATSGEGAAEPDAVRLFVERARAVQPAFELNDEREAVREICRRLDGLPLAIELAAARVRLLRPAALLERLGNALDTLSAGAADMPPRQRTLRATLDWSYELLETEEQDLFRCLGAFTGSASLDAVEALCNPSGSLDVLKSLESLVAKSLLNTTTRPSGDTRVSMLEIIHEYAAGKLRDSPEWASSRAICDEYYIGLGTPAGKGLRGPAQIVWLDRLSDDYANLRTAAIGQVDRGHPDDAVGLLWALWPFLWIRGRVREPLVELRWLISATTDAADDVRRKANVLLAVFEFLDGREDAAARVAGSLINDSDAAGGLARVVLLWCESWRDPTSARHALSEDAARIFERLDCPYEKVLALIVLDRSPWGQEDPSAVDALARTVEAARDVGAPHLVSLVLLNLGRAQLARGAGADARRTVDEATRIAQRIASPENLAYCLTAQAAIAHVEGAHQRAASLLAAADAQIRSVSLSIFGQKNLLDATRAAAGPANFETAWRFGAALCAGEAVALALASSDDPLTSRSN